MIGDSDGDRWFAEAPFGGYQQRYRVRDQLHSETTRWQTLDVLDLESVGRALILANTLQTSVGDEFTYHEPLVHVPMLAHPNPRRVLIVGGGDGGALRHVLLHSSVEHVVEVEIDRAVVEQARRLLPEISGGAYDDPRCELVIADGAAFVAHTSDRFDVILVDSTDPVGPAAPLVQDEFLSGLNTALAPGGIANMQSGSPLTQPREWHATVHACQRNFAIVKPYFGQVPIYPGVQWSWTAVSDELDPTAIDEITVLARLKGFVDQLQVYNPGLHRAAFAMPTYLRRLLELDHEPTSADLRALGHPLPRVVE